MPAHEQCALTRAPPSVAERIDKPTTRIYSMKSNAITTTRRMALYDYYRDRRNAYQKKAYQVLGGKCALCGSTDGLRHRFLDSDSQLSSRYKTNPITLYRKICYEPSVRTAVCLVCRECRVAHRSIAPPIENTAIPGPKPLHIARMEGVNNVG